MIQRFERYHCFKKHHLLNKIQKFINKKNVNLKVKHLANEHLVFIYPNILSFSFKGYRSNIIDNNLSNDNIIDDAPSLTIKKECKISILNNDYVIFFELLKNYFVSENYKPLIVLDLRKIEVIDGFVLTKIIEELSSYRNIPENPSEWINEILIYNPDGNQDDIDNCGAKFCVKFNCFSEFEQEIRRITNLEKNKVTVTLEGPLTLNRLEQLLLSKNVGKSLQNKFIIELNLNFVSNISFWALNLLNVLIFSISREYGVSWQIQSIPRNRKLRVALNEFRFFTANKFFLVIEHKSEDRNKYIEFYSRTLLDYNLRRFGVYIFEKKDIAKVICSFNNYIENLLEYYRDALSQQTKISYELYYTSYKDKVVYQSRIIHIKYIVKELLENIAEHSNGRGYISVDLSQNQLRIFIGDSGIGLKNGIINNYKIEEFITSDKDALSFIYLLDEFHSRRIYDFEFNKGAGFGLKEAFKTIFALKGKVILRSGSCMAAFFNPITRTKKPDFLQDVTYICGSQFMVVIPLTASDAKYLPTSPSDLLDARV